jgi:hypothetical protein
LDELEASTPEGAQSPKAMAEELAQLRKELAKQKRMNEIFKKRWVTSVTTSDALPIYANAHEHLFGRGDV